MKIHVEFEMHHLQVFFKNKKFDSYENSCRI